MEAVLLAGGKGTRLRPFTNVFPKPLMPLGEAEPMPIIEVVLRQLGRFGFRNVTVITGYLTDLIEAVCGHGKPFRTQVTAASTLRWEPREAPALIEASPNRSYHQQRHLTTLDYAPIRVSQGRGATATIASYPRGAWTSACWSSPTHVWPATAKVFLSSEHGRPSLDPSGFPHAGVSDMPELLESMRTAGLPINCFRQECYWLDIGRHDDYATANEIFEARRAAFLGERPSAKLKIGRDQ